jgi:hypothetical protein
VVIEPVVENESLVLNGVGYFTTGHDVSVSYNGIKADHVVIESNFKIVAFWDFGVPLST